MDLHLDSQPRRFYDGGPPGGEPAPEEPPTIVLERTLDMTAHEFRMLRRIGYRDRHLGDLLVPADPTAFQTDLTSVPAIFGWLVPRTGRHLPAALLHDGLVSSSDEGSSYLSATGAQVDRVEANRVFRDAMADTGTGVVRRWLMWAAVTVATAVLGRGTGWSRPERWRWRLTALGTIAVVVLLGVAATLDLFDVTVWGLPGVPWMGSRSWGVELLTGAAGALVVPLALGLLWGRFRVAGMILGIGLAVLLHVTAVILLLTGVYQVAELLATRWPRVAVVLAAALLVVAAAVFVVALR